MLSIKQSVGNVVADDTQSAVHTLDRAVVQQSLLCASVIEASQDSNLAISVTQPLLDAIAAGLRGMVDSRASLAKAVREITRIQGASNLQATSFGCPTGFSAKISDAAETAPELTTAE